MLESKNVFDKHIISKLYATSIKEIVILKKFGNFEIEEIPLSARLVLRSKLVGTIIDYLLAGKNNQLRPLYEEVSMLFRRFKRELKT